MSLFTLKLGLYSRDNPLSPPKLKRKYELKHGHPKSWKEPYPTTFFFSILIKEELCQQIILILGLLGFVS